MRTISVVLLCAAAVLWSGICARGQVFPAHISLTCTKVVSNQFVKTAITEKTLINQCATLHGKDPKQLRLVFIDGDLVVFDAVETNALCPVLGLDLGSLETLALAVTVGVHTNSARFVGLESLGPIDSSNSLIAADFDGVLTFNSVTTLTTNGDLATIVITGSVSAESQTNRSVYTGKLSITGKPLPITLDH